MVARPVRTNGSASVEVLLGWQSWYAGATTVPDSVLLLIVGLHFFNGQYFCEMAVGGYHRHQALANMKRAAKE